MPLYWFRPLAPLSADAGMHRFTWDMHYQPLDGGGRLGGPNLPIAAIAHNTVPLADDAVGQSRARSRSSSRSTARATTQPIVVKQDPRVKTPALALQQIYALSKAMTMARSTRRRPRARRVRSATRSPTSVLAPAARAAGRAGGAGQEARVARAETPWRRAEGRGRGGRAGGGRGGGGACGSAAGSLSAASAVLAGVMNLLQGADVHPTTVQLNAIASARTTAATTMAQVGGDQGGRYGIDEYSIESGWTSRADAHDDTGGRDVSLTQQPAAPAAAQQASASDRARRLVRSDRSSRRRG